MLKKKFIRSALLIFTAISPLYSCETGVDNALVGMWDIHQMLLDGQGIEGDVGTFEFRSDGTCTYIIRVTNVGTWKYDPADSSLIIHKTDPESTLTGKVDFETQDHAVIHGTLDEGMLHLELKRRN